MNCGEKIARLRRKNDMTQAELGDALSVTYQAVSKWERGESQPDFDTISRISKLFQVPISYFEDGADEQVDREVAAGATVANAEIIGMCVRCGKVVHEGDAQTTEPQLICKACAAREQQAEQQRIADKEKAQEEAKQKKQREIAYEKADLKKRRTIALTCALIPAVAVFVLFLVLSLRADKNLFALVFGVGCVLAVFAYTFTSQMIWGGTVREVCTGGGHVMSLPGIIFSLSPDGLVFLIVTKIFMSVVALIVFLGSFVVCFIAAVVISPLAFIPSLLLYNRKIRRVGK